MLYYYSYAIIYTMSAELTGLVIAKDEAVDLPGCLQSLQRVCAEIVVIDNESTDATPEIAMSFGSRVVARAMSETDGFAGLRNAGLEEVRTSHVLVLDADELPTEHLISSISKVMEEGRTDVAYAVNRRNNAFGGYLDHGRFCGDQQTRLFSSDVRYTGIVHETPVLTEDIEVIELEGDLEHFTYNSLAEYIAKMRDYAEKQAQTLADPPSLKHMIGIPAYNAIVRQGYKDGWRGLAMAVGDGWHDHLLRKYHQRQHAKDSSMAKGLSRVLQA
ncbi:MAG: glycosyltransferase [Candidatus Saccharibacteria bacterium]|nr:glycosyltransferase [Candidatus Saccharibacteria bacterium]